MTQPDEPSATLTDEEIRTHRYGAATASVADDADDTGDDSGDVSDATDTGDDSGDVTDAGDDAGDDS